jgi:hypothetical protein
VLHRHKVQLLLLFTPPLLQGDDQKPPYPELFTHLSHATQAHAAGSRSVVGSLDTFKASFAALTGGLFEGIDWSNMVVAGEPCIVLLLCSFKQVAALTGALLEGVDWSNMVVAGELLFRRLALYINRCVASLVCKDQH